MKIVSAKPAIRVRIVKNSQKNNPAHWAKIVDQHGNVLHSGQPRYIERVAKKRYNLLTSI